MSLCPEFVCKLSSCEHFSRKCHETCLIARDIYKCSACLVREACEGSDLYELAREERRKYNSQNK